MCSCKILNCPSELGFEFSCPQLTRSKLCTLTSSSWGRQGRQSSQPMISGTGHFLHWKSFEFWLWGVSTVHVCICGVLSLVDPDPVRYAFVEFGSTEECKAARGRLATTQFKGKELIVDFVGEVRNDNIHCQSWCKCISGEQEQAPEREVRGQSTQQAKSHQVPFLKFHPTLPGLLHKWSFTPLLNDEFLLTQTFHLWSGTWCQQNEFERDVPQGTWFSHQDLNQS